MKRILFVTVFVLLFMALSFLGLMLAISAGIGPADAGDPPITFRQEVQSFIGAWFVKIMWFPVTMIREAFFRGRPLPGSDWLWIGGCGSLYAGIVLWIYERNSRR